MLFVLIFCIGFMLWFIYGSDGNKEKVSVKSHPVTLFILAIVVIIGIVLLIIAGPSPDFSTEMPIGR